MTDNEMNGIFTEAEEVSPVAEVTEVSEVAEAAEVAEETVEVVEEKTATQTTEYMISADSEKTEDKVASKKEECKAAKKALAEAKKAKKAERKEMRAQEKANRKPDGPFKKIMVSIACGLLFGLFAGVGVFAVDQATGFLKQIGSEKAEVNTDDIVSKVIAEVGNTSKPSTNNSGSVAVTTPIVSPTQENSIVNIVDEVMPAMVSVYNTYSYTTNANDFFSMYGFGGFGNYGGTQVREATSTGTGIIIGQTETELLVVTNNHVVEGADTLTVEFIDEENVSASLKGTNADMDLAVIAVSLSGLSDDTLSAIRVARLGSSDDLLLGEQVVAIGNALGYGQSVTVGYVSALNRQIMNEEGYSISCIQTDAAINEGNSGGALLNMNGEVVGINCAKIASTTVEGMGYAIPVSNALDIIDDLQSRVTKGQKVPEDERGYIGINLQEVTPDISKIYGMPVGIFVSATTPGSGAEAAGLIRGDVITHFDGERITSYNELQELLQYYAAGTTVEIKFQRTSNGEYEEHTVDLTLGVKSK